jgi:putative transposase
LAESDRNVRIAAVLNEGGRIMARKQRHTPEQVIGKLREAEVKLAKGTAIVQVCKDLSITENTYYRWRREYGGMKVDQARRLKELEKENARLKRLLADAELDKAILKEAASGKY